MQIVIDSIDSTTESSVHICPWESQIVYTVQFHTTMMTFGHPLLFNHCQKIWQVQDINDFEGAEEFLKKPYNTLLKAATLRDVPGMTITNLTKGVMHSSGTIGDGSATARVP